MDRNQLPIRLAQIRNPYLEQQVKESKDHPTSDYAFANIPKGPRHNRVINQRQKENHHYTTSYRARYTMDPNIVTQATRSYSLGPTCDGRYCNNSTNHRIRQEICHPLNYPIQALSSSRYGNNIRGAIRRYPESGYSCTARYSYIGIDDRNKLRKENIISSLRSKGVDSSTHAQKDLEETTLRKLKKIQLNEGPSFNKECKISIKIDPLTRIQDKVSFMINNLSSDNIDAKAKEFSEILKEQHYSWFAWYIVSKRARLEANFHELYLKLIDQIGSKALNQEILNVTYETCKNMLKSENIKSSVEDRSFLNNLGSWLGKITIRRNLALSESEIDPKSLIIEAYETGSMTAIVPFISKILESAKNSLAFQPPNIWTMEILGLLVEIYKMPNLKMNLIFAIEILFRNLGLGIKDVSHANLLKDKPRLVEGNPDFSSRRP